MDRDMDQYGIENLDDLQEEHPVDCGPPNKRPRTLNIGYRQERPSMMREIFSDDEYTNLIEDGVYEGERARAVEPDERTSTINIYTDGEDAMRPTQPKNDIGDDTLELIRDDLATIVNEKTRKHELFDFVSSVQGFLDQEQMMRPDGSYAGFDNSELWRLVDRIMKRFKILQGMRRADWRKRLREPDFPKKIEYLQSRKNDLSNEIAYHRKHLKSMEELESALNNEEIYKRMADLLENSRDYKIANRSAREKPLQLPNEDFQPPFSYSEPFLGYSATLTRDVKDEKIPTADKRETDLITNFTKNAFLYFYVYPLTFYATELIEMQGMQLDEQTNRLRDMKIAIKDYFKDMTILQNEESLRDDVTTFWEYVLNAFSSNLFNVSGSPSPQEIASKFQVPENIERGTGFENQPRSKVQVLKKLLGKKADTILTIQEEATVIWKSKLESLQEAKGLYETTITKLENTRQQQAERASDVYENTSLQKLETQIANDMRHLENIEPESYITVDLKIVSAMNATFTLIKNTFPRNYGALSDASDIATTLNDQVRTNFANAVALKIRLSQVNQRRTGYVQNNHLGQVRAAYGSTVAQFKHYIPTTTVAPIEFADAFTF